MSGRTSSHPLGRLQMSDDVWWIFISNIGSVVSEGVNGTGTHPKMSYVQMQVHKNGSPKMGDNVPSTLKSWHLHGTPAPPGAQPGVRSLHRRWWRSWQRTLHCASHRS